MCTAVDSTLVSIHSQEENTFVRDLAAAKNPSAGAVYIGLRRTVTGAFYWTDGTLFDFGAATQPKGQFPWSPQGVYPAQPDALPAPGDVTQIWLPGATNQVAGSWDDINGGTALAGAVCKRPLQSAQIPRSTGDNAVHDPTLIHIGDTYVVYSTHNGMEARQSTDKVNWQRAGAAFPNGLDWIVPITTGSPDASNPRMEFWAPDVSFHNGKYWLYYCASKYGSQISAIGVATSDTGMPGTWQDQGKVLGSQTGSPYNAIDPNLFVDTEGTGKWWLQFGSFWGGIFQVELDSATGNLAPGAQPKQIASRPGVPNNPVEGPFLYKKGNFYYLFNSYDHCCAAPLTYSIRVGRSSSPNGPFVDRAGVPMLQGGGTVLRGTSGTRLAPGGQSVYADADGTDLLAYHYYDSTDQNRPKLAVEQLAWSDDNWPYILQ